MNRDIRPIGRSLFAASVLIAFGCGGPELSGPPELRLGRDECAECGMLIAEDRCAAALLAEIERRREHRIFDDLCCLFDYRAKHADETVIGAFARDYGAGGWIGAQTAAYVLSEPDRQPTPMASGMVAFADPAAAAMRATETGGRVLDYEALAAARAAIRASWRKSPR
ncbi:MAG: nitrous oxide reductase accessory protein NosL [Phycisphaerae bacterium]|nr:nitrous oxide reductase accessory protein NosL [Phycisphaerae bacterium]